MSRSDEFLSSTHRARIAQAAGARPKARPVPRIHPKDVDSPAYGAGVHKLCLEDFAAFGACIMKKGHAGEVHRDANGYGWHRPAEPTRYVRPDGRPEDTSQHSGGSMAMVGDATTPELAKGAKWDRLKAIGRNPFQGYHAVFGSQN